MNEEKLNAFSKFLKEDVMSIEWPTKVMSNNSTITIQQTKRNELRRQGQAALKIVLEELIKDAEGLELYETGEGLIIGCRGVNGDPDLTFYWELSSTIKALNYDAELEQQLECARREEIEAKALNKAKEEQIMAEKRAKREAKARQKNANANDDRFSTNYTYDWSAPVIKLKRIDE